jgi:hypothetical protein
LFTEIWLPVSMPESHTARHGATWFALLIDFT